MKLNEKIFSCRKKAGMSQEALAEKLGISRQAISKWELGTAVPELENLLAISKLFGVTTDWLLSDEDENEDTNDEDASDDHDPVTDALKASRMAQNSEQWGEADPGFDTQLDGTHDYDGFKDSGNPYSGIPGTLGRYAKKLGWILGVYISCIGAGLAALGGVVKFIVSHMVTGFTSTVRSVTGTFGGGYGGIIVEAPEDMPDEILEAIYDSMGGMGYSPADPMISFAENNPVSIVAGLMIFAGVVMIIGGVILAWYLYRLGRKAE